MSIKTGLILSGGGARAAYQVGVLQALADILPKNTRQPFPYYYRHLGGSS